MNVTIFIGVLIGTGVALSAAMALGWIIWRRTGNSGWIDVSWTFGLGGTCLIGSILPITGADGPTLRQGLVAALMLAWTARLGLHIAERTSGISDDPRYAKLAREWGDDAKREMFSLAQKQALVTIPLALSVLLAAWNPAPGLRLLDIAAVAVLAVAIVGEALADRQLRQFRAGAAKGEVCDAGLWAWSRHPNYFFQWFGWLAYPLFAINLTGAYPWGWIALIGPVCMYWLLAHISGVPPLEEHMVAKYGEPFRAYQRRTNAFFPAPPRNG